MVRRYIDFCADINIARRRSMLNSVGCQYAQFYFGHVPLSPGVASVTVNNLTAGALDTFPAVRLWMNHNVLWRRRCEPQSLLAHLCVLPGESALARSLASTATWSSDLPGCV